MRLASGPFLLSLVVVAACVDQRPPTAPAREAVLAHELDNDAPDGVSARGRHLFRHDTFGDEPFWTDTLKLNQVIETAV